MRYANIYTIWASMCKRCNNKNNKDYKNYGGRGIKICESWEKFENFYADMGDRPKGLTIERIDNNVGYSPSNCKWATYMEQNRNRRDNRIITYGSESKCLAEWADVIGVKYMTLFRRLERHPPQIAFNM